MNDISEYGDYPHVLDADRRSDALKKALDVELADVPSTQHDEGVFLVNLAAAIESLNNIVFWAGECVAGRMSHNDFLVNVQCSAAAARSLPARNCDVYRTKEEAEKAFLSEPCDEPCGNCTIKDINNECGIKWLFAEYKGKAKK